MNGVFSSQGQPPGPSLLTGMQGDANAQLNLNQAITRCQSCFEVLQLLGEVKQADMIPSAANMATAMHRIASTGAQQPDTVKAQVLGDMRFRNLVLGVEDRLERMPQDFGEQHLANVVWGAAKLRLKREPLFNLVQREVLSDRRRLSDFSPQQLAAIAWAFAMMAFDAPYLFEAVQEEAGRQPILARMLEQAGLLRRSESALPNDRTRVVWSGAVGQQQAQHQGQQQAVQQAQTQQTTQQEHGYQQHGQQAKSAGGQWSQQGQGLPSQQGQHSASHGPVGVGAGGLPRGFIGDSSSAPGPSSMHQKPVGSSQGTGAIIGPPGGGGSSSQGSQPALSGFAAAARPGAAQANAGGSNGLGGSNSGAGGASDSASANASKPDGSKNDGMAVAAEQHRKEMEEKQRQVLGDEDGGATCPLCCEELDSTDMSFLPCPCGYQVCLLCFNKIQNEGNKQCPACRTEYNEENFKTQAPPEKKKKTEDADLGWETGNKKKANQKKSPPLTFPGFAPKVAEMLLQCHDQGIVTRGELDERVMEDLKNLPERGGIAVLSEFMKKDMTRIRNKSAFLNGIIIRVQEELQNDRPHPGDKMPANHAGVPHGVGPIGGGHQQARNASPQRSAAGALPAGQGAGASSVHPPAHAGIQQPGRGNATSHSTPRGWGGNEDEIVINQGMGSLHIGGQNSGFGDRDVTPEQQELARQQVEHFLLQRAQAQQAHQQRMPGQMGYHPMQGGFGGVQTLFGGNMHSGSNNGGGILNNLQWDQQGGDQEMPSGAEAGSRILAMLQTGTVEKRDERRDKPPLFMRSNGTDNRRGGHGMGGLGGEEHIQIPGMYQHQGLDSRAGGHNQDELAFLPVDDPKDQNRQVDTCAQCKSRSTGEIDQSDGCFYCDNCWNAFVNYHSNHAPSHDTRARNTRIR